MEEKYVMKFRSKGDYLLFIWMIAVCSIIGIGAVIKGKINIFVPLWFFIGAYTTLVLALWVNRNKRIWRESLKKCPSCGSENFIKNGWNKGKNGGKIQRYKCNTCGKDFTERGVNIV